MGCQIDDERFQEGDRVGRISNKCHLMVLRELFYSLIKKTRLSKSGHPDGIFSCF